jgi:chromosome segregation ATPase
MAGEGATSFTSRLKDTIRKKDKKIKNLEEQIKELQEQLSDHNENCQTERLKKENQSINEKNKTMDTEITELKESYQWLEEDTHKKLNEYKIALTDRNERIKSFQLSEEQLCIAQLCTSLQENICEIVLQLYYDEKSNKNTKHMEEYIKNQIESKVEQKRARKRWKLLKKEMKWTPYWIITLKPLGRKVANPPLTEERIKRAKFKMKQEGILSKNMAKAVDTLMHMWKETNSKLSHSGKLIINLHSIHCTVTVRMLFRFNKRLFTAFTWWAS